LANTSPLKLGLIGCGHIARFHARNIKDVLSRQPINILYHATCDRELDRARTFAEIAGCELATRDAAELIAACDVVYICTETAEHSSLVHQAAAAGRHIFCEKPLATGLADASQMAAAVNQAGVINQVGLILNYSPVFTVLQQLMSADDYGPVLSVHLRDDQCFPIGDHYGSNWRADVSRAGAGTLLEHSIHDVDLLRRLFGEIEAVNCRTREISGHPGIEDLALVNFHHRGGQTSTLNSIWHAMPARQSSRSLEVFFNRARFTTEQDYFGSITYQVDDQPAVTLSSDEVLARFMTMQALEPVTEDLRSLGGLSDRRFLEAVVEGKPAQPGFADALASHEIVDACYRSAAVEGGTVMVR
jgi:predicted dehydrogenase